MSENLNEPHIFFRRGEKAHIENLLKKGEVYINTVDSLRNFDKNRERTDFNECIKAREFSGDVKIKTCNVGLDINLHGDYLEAKNFAFNTDTTIKGNLYCLSAIYTKDFLEDNNLKEFKTESFGESVIIIKDPIEFINRLKGALKSIGFNEVFFGAVDYFANDYSGEVGFFKKHEGFQSQNEFRFFIPNKKNDTIVLEIGSIEDIAFISEGCHLKFELTNGKTKEFSIPRALKSVPNKK